MRNLVLGTSIIVLGACGPSERDGNGGQPDAAMQTGDGSQQGPASRVYAHSGDKLYQIDTQTLAPVNVGTMAGLGTQSLTDLAIDKADKMVGITLDKLYTINAQTGAATLVTALATGAQSQNFTSLSFVPGPTMADPDMLISANDQGNVYKIDEVSGVATQIGNYGMHNGMQVKSSGDIFGVRGFGIFATVDVGNGTMDYLARIDPTTWKATPLPNATGYDQIFGLGFWGGKIYGFVADGQPATTGKLIDINSTTGTATMLNTSGVRWFGAGVTTSAPILL